MTENKGTDSIGLLCYEFKMQKILLIAISFCLLTWSSLGCAQVAEPPAKNSKPIEDQARHAHTNALAKETSPYLLMHAHNPVNWYAWNEESLTLAKKEDKPIFLSIGYSSCHWCHVMERESFLDDEIANFLNEHFICIKVDREERPDVDEIYMEALQTFNRLSRNNRGGGWPLSMFLLSDGRPFFGGTYFPARTGDRGDSIGFLRIITRLAELYATNRQQFNKDAEVITEITRESLAGRDPIAGTTIQRGWLTSARSGLQEEFDPKYGGFGFSDNNSNVPKFPQPSNLMFLADQLQRNPADENIKRMFVTTCQQMMMGGVYDHLGGGFHRYSVDRFWQIPHYEKMLYDNGQLATVYSLAYEITGNEEFKRVVEGMLEFVERELKSEQGGFYAALDAESEGVEGKFYVWDLDEIKSALTPAEYQLFAPIYGLDRGPNFEGKHYAPQLSEPLAAHAKRMNIALAELESKLSPIRQKLFDLRSQRVRPLLDHKILTGWNGLMIRGFADAGRVFKNANYVATAARAADFALQHLRTDDGRLVRTSTDGTSKLNGYLDDYACLIDGLLALHRATNEVQWLDAAEQLQQKQDALFWDAKNGGYFYTSSDHEALLARSKNPIDNAVPAGNSVAAANLLYLAEALKNDDYRERARRTVISASPIIQQIPTAAPRLLVSAAELLE